MRDSRFFNKDFDDDFDKSFDDFFAKTARRAKYGIALALIVSAAILGFGGWAVYRLVEWIVLTK